MYIVKNLYIENVTTDMLRRKLKNLTLDGVLTWWALILHDKDKKGNGEEKKAHFHLLVESDSKSHHLKNDLKEKLGGNEDIWIGCEPSQRQIEAVRNVKQAVRYLTHKDNLEKYQYDDEKVFTSDIELYNDYIRLQIKTKEVDNMLDALLDLCLAKYEKGEDMTRGELLLYFKRIGRLDYWLKNSSKISQMISEYLDVMTQKPF